MRHPLSKNEPCGILNFCGRQIVVLGRTGLQKWTTLFGHQIPARKRTRKDRDREKRERECSRVLTQESAGLSVTHFRLFGRTKNRDVRQRRSFRSFVSLSLRACAVIAYKRDAHDARKCDERSYAKVTLLRPRAMLVELELTKRKCAHMLCVRVRTQVRVQKKRLRNSKR